MSQKVMDLSNMHAKVQQHPEESYHYQSNDPANSYPLFSTQQMYPKHLLVTVQKLQWKFTAFILRFRGGVRQ